MCPLLDSMMCFSYVAGHQACGFGEEASCSTSEPFAILPLEPCYWASWVWVSIRKGCSWFLFPWPVFREWTVCTVKMLKCSWFIQWICILFKSWQRGERKEGKWKKNSDWGEEGGGMRLREEAKGTKINLIRETVNKRTVQYSPLGNAVAIEIQVWPSNNRVLLLLIR